MVAVQLNGNMYHHQFKLTLISNIRHVYENGSGDDDFRVGSIEKYQEKKVFVRKQYT